MEMQSAPREGYFAARTADRYSSRMLCLEFRSFDAPSRVIADWDFTLQDAADLALDLLLLTGLEPGLYNQVKEALE